MKANQDDTGLEQLLDSLLVSCFPAILPVENKCIPILIL